MGGDGASLRAQWRYINLFKLRGPLKTLPYTRPQQRLDLGYPGAVRGPDLRTLEVPKNFPPLG
jgi:hypothetical protein